MYLRFVVRRQDSDSGFFEGVFRAAYELRDRGALEPWEQDWLERELAWFRMHLKVPRCLHLPENRRAICWFHPRASRPIAKARSIAALLGEKGVPVDMIKTHDPGRILYRDGWQVVAKAPHRRSGRRTHRGPRGSSDAD